MRHADPRGFSLPEVLVSTFFTVLFGATLFEFHRTVLRSVRLREEMGHAQDAARIAIEVVTHELRVSGYSAAAAPLLGLRVATPERVEIQADLNGDGDTNDANEVVAYRYDAIRQALMRATGNAPAQPMVENVPPGAFTLRYWDAAGNELAGDLDAAARARVRQIEIGLGVTYASPDPAIATTRVLTEHATVQLRNRAP